MEKTLFLRPRLSEKTYGLSVAHNVYVIEVPQSANKLMVARAVEAQFGVAVVAVNVTTIKGKTKRTVRKGARPVAGKRSDIKKAYITLKQGDKLPFFPAEETDKADKKAAKKEKK